MARRGHYDKQPSIPVGPAAACEVGWPAITARLEGLRSRRRCVVAVECYPGVQVDEVKKAFGEGLRPALVVDARQAYRDAAEIERMCAPYLGDDPVFGRMNGLAVGDFLDPGRTAVQRGRIEQGSDRPGARRRDRGLSRRRAGRARVRRPRPVGDPAEAAAARGREPGRPRPAGSPREALQARLLRGLARGRPPEAHAPRAGRLAARHERPRGAPDDRRRRLPARPGPRREEALPRRALLRPRPLGRAVDEGGLRPAAGGAELRLVLRLRARGEQPAARLRRDARRGPGPGPRLPPPARAAGRGGPRAFRRRVPDPVRLPGHDGRGKPLAPGAPADRVHPGPLRDALHAGRELLPPRRGGGGLRVPRREGGRRPRGHAARPAPRAGRRGLPSRTSST